MVDIFEADEKQREEEIQQWWKDNWDSYEYYAEDGTTRLYDTIPD